MHRHSCRQSTSQSSLCLCPVSVSLPVCLSVSISDSLLSTLFLRLVVGAPVANSTTSPLVKSPGAIYRCDISAEHRRCHQMQSGVVLCVHILCGKIDSLSLITDRSSTEVSPYMHSLFVSASFCIYCSSEIPTL